MPARFILGTLTRPWVVAAGGAVAAWAFYKRTQSQQERLKDAKLELIEMQRTVDRLRAELGRARHQNEDRHAGPY